MSTRPTADTLIQHARGLRAVARNLLADDASADDVVQETWRLALERPPHGGRGVGAWLREVTRRTALRHRRGEARRVRRERASARPERLASTVEVLADREILRRVVGAVLALPEPYQTALVLRFYEDLPPREIARRSDVTVATVKSRIQRGLARMREDLDQSSGSREHWARALVAATGLLPSAAAVAVAHGGWSMQSKLLVAAAGVGVVALGVTSWSAPAGPAAGETPDEGEVVVGLAQDDEAVASARAEEPGRTAVPAASLPAPWLPSHPGGAYELTLTGVVDEVRDAPYEAAHVYVAAPLGPWNDVGEADREGRFAVTLRAHEPELDVLVWASKGLHQVQAARLVRLSAAGPTRVRLRVEDEPLGGIERRVEGLPNEVARLRTIAGDQLPELAGGAVLVRDLRLPARLGLEPRLALADGRFQWPTPASIRGEAASIGERSVVGVGGGVVGRGERIERVQIAARIGEEELVDVSSGAFIEVVDEEDEPAEITLAGRVVDADGEPVGGAWLRALTGGAPWWSRADDDGSFELAITIDGDDGIALRAGGLDDGLATGSFDAEALEAGATLTWNPVLDRGLELRGRLDFADDVAPELRAATWFAEYRGAGAQPCVDRTTVVDSEFAIPNLPAGSGELFVRWEGSDFPSYVERVVGPGAGSLALELDAADLALGALDVVVESEHGSLAGTPEVRLIQLDTGVAASMSQVRGRFVQRLPVGRYRVLAGAPEHGFVDAGVALVIANELVEVRAQLSAPGHVDLGGITTARGGLVWALHRVDLADGAIGAQVATGVLGRPFDDALPAGRYALALEAPDRSVAPIFFDVPPGGRARPELAIDELGELALVAPDDAVALSLIDAGTGVARWQGPVAGRARLLVPAGSYRVVPVDGSVAEARVTTARGEVSRVELVRE